MWLAATRNSYSDKTVTWQEQHIELGNFYADNIIAERNKVAQLVCDRLWQAFHREKCECFDAAGNYTIPR